MTSRWPKCLKYFKLERLSFEYNNYVYSAKIFRQELEQLHSGLKYLQIFAYNAMEAMLPPFDLINAPANAEPPVVDDEEPAPSKRTKTHDSDQATTHQTLWDLNHTWPTLEHLEIASHRNHSYSGNTLFCYNTRTLALLPRSLTFFSLQCARLRPLLELMPPNLATFRVCHQSLLPEDLYQLPKTITDLGTSVSEDGLILLARERDLLPRLQAFTPMNSHSTNFLRPILEGSLPWPSFIKELTGVFVVSSTYKPLPPDWRFQNWDTAYVTPGSLPRGLTSLSVSEIEWKDIDASTWPSTLTNLSLIHSHSFTIECLHMLPRQLKHCAIGTHQQTTYQPIHPYDFDLLCELGRNSVATDPLWPSLKHEIMAYRSASVTLEALESYIKSIESGRLFGLPLTLTSLQLPHLLLPTTAKLLLPPRVSRVIHDLHNDESPQCAHLSALLLESLPPMTSAYFEINYKYGVSVNSLQNTLLSDTLSPSRLSSLKLSGPDFRVSEDLFRNLPQTITFLSLTPHDYNGIDPEHLQLQSLPNLKSLELGANILKNPLDPWVHYLPRTLEKLHTPFMILIGHHVKDLPPNLTSLYCSFFELSLPQILDLPLKLSSLQINHADGHKTTSSRHALTSKALYMLIWTYKPFWRTREAGLHGMTVELSIAAKQWRLKPNAHHTGAIVKNLSIPLPKGFKLPTNGEIRRENYDYTSANVTRYLKLKDDGSGPDPRTVRRVSGYL